MLSKFKRALIGKPLKNEAIHGQKYSVLSGLPILASDAISSVAYAGEEILLILVPAIGVLAYQKFTYISAAIIGLLFILTFSYRQTIQAYPNGGGAYIVASDNLGKIPGVTAAAALATDYVLTVAVSISSGTAAITSAFPGLLPFTVPICVLILLLIMLGNLRGIKESARLFSMPTYAFVVTMLIMIVTGIIGHFTGTIHVQASAKIPDAVQPVTTILLLSAFANGCSALTGVEAVSNAIPNFKKPRIKNAQKVLLLMSTFVFLIFGGIAVLVKMYNIVPVSGRTVLSQLAETVFGRGVMFYIIQATTAVILVMAVNTSYSDFPMLSSLIARDEFMPRQLSHRGDRLSFSNGIIVLTVIAGILIVAFKGSTKALIPLYSVGVFISFTLSQFGMFKRWITTREGHWVHKAIINGIGALVTAVVVVIVGYTKFKYGAWIVIVIIPLLVLMMLKVKQHYEAIGDQLRLSEDELESIDFEKDKYKNRVIIPIESINRASVRAIRYAKTISDHVVAFNVSTDEESGEKIKQKYALLKTDVPLYVKYSPYRKVFEPLIKFIESEEYDYVKGDMITVIIPEFEVHKWWQKILHNQSGRHISRQLLNYKHIVVATMPLQMKNEGLLFKREKNG